MVIESTNFETKDKSFFNSNRNFQKWVIGNAFAMTISFFLAILTSSIFWMPIIALSAFVVLFYNNKIIFQKNPPFGGYANLITALRFLITSLSALFIQKIPDLVGFFLFGTAILLDGVDGWVARKYQQQNDLGALFDKATDAFFVLLLSFVLVNKYDIPYWFLAIGYLHYGYELVIYSFNWQYLVIPKNPVGKYIAATLFISLLSPFILPDFLYLPILYIAAILTVCSFGVSFWFKINASRRNP